mgnify:CR=1 FL=1
MAMSALYITGMARGFEIPAYPCDVRCGQRLPRHPRVGLSIPATGWRIGPRRRKGLPIQPPPGRLSRLETWLVEQSQCPPPSAVGVSPLWAGLCPIWRGRRPRRSVQSTVCPIGMRCSTGTARPHAPGNYPGGVGERRFFWRRLVRWVSPRASADWKWARRFGLRSGHIHLSLLHN